MEEPQRRPETSHREKKPYIPPTVKKVTLRPEEAVLGFCKNSSMSGPRGMTCTALGPCSFLGS